MKRIIPVFAVAFSLLLSGCSNELKSVEEQLKDNNISVKENHKEKPKKDFDSMVKNMKEQKPIEMLANIIGKNNLELAKDASSVNISNNESVTSFIKKYKKIDEYSDGDKAHIYTGIGYITEKLFNNSDAALFYSREQGVDLSREKKSLEYTIEFFLENQQDEIIYLDVSESELYINGQKLNVPLRGGQEAKGQNSFQKGIHQLSITYQLPLEVLEEKNLNIDVSIPQVLQSDGTSLIPTQFIKNAI